MASEVQKEGPTGRDGSHNGGQRGGHNSGHNKKRHHREHHRIDNLDWLRAAVMGANDGILSIGALLVGVAGAHIGTHESLVAGFAGLVAGAGSMAMGEYVSVSAEKDTFDAEHELEARELAEDPVGETEELRGIYQKRGLSHDLAHEVAVNLMEHDALGAHMRDELGYTDTRRPRPVLAAVSSFFSFCLGAIVPITATALSTDSARGPITAAATLASLVVLGAVAARLGGSSILRGSARVAIGGLLALTLSHLAGSLFGSSGPA